MSRKQSKHRIKEPVVFYVVWHPACVEGASLASALFDWFHLGDNDISRMGIGVPVYYRSLPGPDGQDHPLEIPHDAPRLTIILLLIDKNMVADRGWSDYINAISRDEQRINRNDDVDSPYARIYPVALDETAFRLPGDIAARNFLRIEDSSDAEVDLAIERSERRKQRFLREVTELACRLMLYRRSLIDEGASEKRWKDADIPRPINIFLSHSKADGAEIAKAMRDYMNQKSQLRPFFDETDLALGFRYAKVLRSKARSGTAAMIAIYSDSYPFRPWCLTEIKLARQPQNMTHEGSDEPTNCWWLNPLVVVSALSDEESRCLPEFGEAPVMRWEAGRERVIVDILLRELFFQTYNYLWALDVQKEVSPPEAGEQSERTHFLTWIPSIRTLEQMRTVCGEAWGPGLRIYHPGEGVIHGEIRSTKILPEDSIVCSFEEINDVHMRNELPADWPMLGISLSTDQEQIARFGYAKEHLAYFLLVIIRRLLRCGARIAFAGDLCDSDRQYNESMIQLAQEELRNHSSESENRLSRESYRPVFYCFMAWPQGSRVTIEKRAEFIDSCVFLEDIDGGVNEQNDALKQTPTTLYHEFRRSLSLSKARYLMTYGTTDDNGNPLEGIRARIVLGGKCEGFEGIMPGILEEVYWALRRNRSAPSNSGTAIYILGGFGGAARLLADYLLNTKADDVPPWAAPDYYLDEKRSSTRTWREGFQRLVGEYQQYAHKDSEAPWARSSEDLYNDLREELREAHVNSRNALRNGLSLKDNRHLMISEDIYEICGLIEKGLMKLAPKS